MRAWAVLAVGSFGCAPLPASSMADLDFPPGFEFSTTREVVFAARGASPGPDVRLVVRTPDGAPLFDGGLGLALRHPLRLRVPSGATAIDVTVGAHTERVALADRVDWVVPR